MTDEQRSECEELARRVGRKTLPPEWRDGILRAAMGGGEPQAAARENVVDIAEPAVPGEPGSWEKRIRKAERRAVWSIAACFVMALVVVVLLVRSESTSSGREAWPGTGLTRNLRGYDWRNVAGDEAEESGREVRRDVPGPRGPSEPRQLDAGGRDARERTDTGIAVHGRTHFAWDRGDRDGTDTLEGLGSRKGVDLSGTSSVGGVAVGPDTRSPRTREESEAAKPELPPLSGGGDSSLLALGPLAPGGDDTDGDKDLDGVTADDWKRREDAVLWRRLAKIPDVARLPMDGSERDLAKNLPPSTGAPVPKPSLRNQRPVFMSEVASNSLTEEVRYMIDSASPAGEYQREVGVTIAVAPTVLPDGSIRMTMRPRSAETVETIVGQSGRRYTDVDESMLEKVADIPPGHSLVVGGFYGEASKKSDSKVPHLGDTPEINLFLKGEEAAEEDPSLLFVVTPTATKSGSGRNDTVTLDTKVLKVNDAVPEQVDFAWQAGRGEAGVPAAEAEMLNSLLGIGGRKPGEGDRPVAGDGAIVLSPDQTHSVLETLVLGGLVKRVSNPTVTTGENEAATISLIDRVPVVTTTPDQSEHSESRPEPKAPEPAPDEPEKDAREEPWSTFSLNVSDVSFKLAKAALGRGEWPAVDRIRVEEFVNAFDYHDRAPSQEEKVACTIEQAAHPFMQQRNLLRVSMKTAALGRAASTPLRLTVLLDTSGSMVRTDRVESVQRALELLAAQLHPDDQVTLIGFARTPRLLADRLPGNRVAELAAIVDATPSAGGTNIEEALKLGLEKAREQIVPGAQNRIILLTDGAVNLGNARPDDLANLVGQMRGNGISFDACGVGADGYNDAVLEALTRKGDGRYYFLDRPEDADRGFARQIAGALRPAARNVKVQVKFNPERVGRYKLYGFRRHRLQKEDFRDDRVDAAELAAAEAGNALYQFEALPEGTGDIGTVSVRFQDTGSGRMIEREWTIPYVSRIPRLEDAAPSLRLASGAALLGEKLKGGAIGDAVEMEDLDILVSGLPAEFPADRRVQALQGMVRKVRDLSGG